MRQACQYLPEERARLALRRSLLKDAWLKASQELVVQPQQQRPALEVQQALLQQAAAKARVQLQ
jgi:hypothetical protein